MRAKLFLVFLEGGRCPSKKAGWMSLCENCSSLNREIMYKYIRHRLIIREPFLL